ncbi:MAG: pyruvate, phosphate dikinase/phosphoenolpyruvate synthase regulator [Rhizobiaceae bacterium]|nr:pyruvate, phosphate dikinase/phosphoenolpyruvate synthase regulator [Rhizobiaceae bacterium]
MVKRWIQRAREKVSKKTFFHLHLISDSTGETLITTGRAAAAQYTNWRAVEHVTPMVRSAEKLEKALNGVDATPGIVLYTMVDQKLESILVNRCKALGVPAVNVLDPVTKVFDGFLGDTMSGRVGAQHAMDEEYFDRLEAVQFAMAHDDGNLPDDIEEAEIILIGISRTSKTPTSIYLAQRGIKTINIPLVPGVDLPAEIISAKQPLVVALVASAERILQVRENRLLAFDRDLTGDIYVDRASIQEELALTRRLCKQNNWPMIDVSKRSVEETAAAILALRRNRT